MYAKEGIFITFGLVLSVLGSDVYTADSTSEDTDLGSLAAGLDNAGLVLNADDLTDDTANSRDLVTYLEIVSHFSGSLFLLFLRTDTKEIEYHENGNEHEYRNDHRTRITTGSRAGGAACKHQCIDHSCVPFDNLYFSHLFYFNLKPSDCQSFICKFFVYLRKIHAVDKKIG